MTRQFSSTDHLSPEAVAAFADGELSASATRRAKAHIAQCTECHEEVVSQLSAAQRIRFLRSDDCVKAPTALIEKLTSICEDASAEAVEAKAPQPARSRVVEALEAIRRGRVT